MRKSLICAVLLALPASGVWGEDVQSKECDVRDVVGSCHNILLYSFGKKDCLNEGADMLLELGTRTMKLAFRDHLEGYYPFDSDWPDAYTLVDVAQTKYFHELFSKPFTTFIMMTYRPEKDLHYLLHGMTPDDVKQEQDAFCEITKYLLTKYKGTGKTFIFQNWEGDWVLTGPAKQNRPPWTHSLVETKKAQGMIDWLNARQDGVQRARDEIGCNNVMVAHAAEANLLTNAMMGLGCVTNTVIPYTHCDLYSYSSYDTMLQSPEKFREALDYLAEKAPDSPLYGSKNIFIGEFGAPENTLPDEFMYFNEKAVEVALEWGVQYALFWHSYCDGWKDGKGTGRRPTNDDLVGNWLIRPDGSKSPQYDYFQTLFRSGRKCTVVRPFVK